MDIYTFLKKVKVFFFNDFKDSLLKYGNFKDSLTSVSRYYNFLNVHLNLKLFFSVDFSEGEPIMVWRIQNDAVVYR